MSSRQRVRAAVHSGTSGELAPKPALRIAPSSGRTTTTTPPSLPSLSLPSHPPWHITLCSTSSHAANIAQCCIYVANFLEIRNVSDVASTTDCISSSNNNNNSSSRSHLDLNLSPNHSLSSQRHRLHLHTYLQHDLDLTYLCLTLNHERKLVHLRTAAPHTTSCLVAKIATEYMSRQAIPPFQKVANFRDVASSTASSSLKSGLLFRSAAPDDATPVDRSRLSTEIGLKTIIDLRSDTEHREVTKKNALKVPPAPDPPGIPRAGQGHTEHTDPLNPLRVPGVKYELINFNGSAYSSHLIWQLSYLNIAKLFTWYTLGWRTDAISILGTNVMQKRGLVGLAQDSLELCRKEVKLVFDVLASQNNYPLLVHCTQGKDRTGLVILLVSMLLGVEESSIEKDYLLSEEGLSKNKEERVKAIATIGLGAEFAGCPQDWVEKVVQTIKERHRGIKQYLTSCGVDAIQQKSVKDLLG